MTNPTRATETTAAGAESVPSRPQPAERGANRRRLGHQLFVVAMGLLIGIPPLAQALAEWRLEGRPRALELFAVVPSREAFRELEADMERRSWLGHAARTDWAEWVDSVLDRGGANVVIGSKGWLFYRPSLRFVAGRHFEPGTVPVETGSKQGALLPDGQERHASGDTSAAEDGALEPAVARVRDVVLDFRSQLRARGKRLLFVPVPTKATLYPERLSRALAAPSEPAEAPNDPGVGALLDALRSDGVDVLDPLPLLLEAKLAGSDVFLPADTHWSWFGMMQVVEAVAERLASGAEAGSVLAQKPAGQVFDQRRVLYGASGDLHRMLGYGGEGAAEGRRADEAITDYEVIQVVGDRDGLSAVRSPAPVMVIGDSSTLVFSEPSLRLGRGAGFAERLAFAIGQPVDLLATPAGGATRVRRLLALEAERLAAAEVVVWVLGQRSLALAAEGWHRVELPPEPTEGVGSGAANGGREPLFGPVEARVVKVSKAPRQKDYADCLMIVRYATLDSEPRIFDVAHVGWRNFEPTAEATLEEGDVMELDLRDLPREWSLDRTCWVDDVGLISEPRWSKAHAPR